jgi:NitT/TauT family transport system substrate-binding protein
MWKRRHFRPIMAVWLICLAALPLTISCSSSTSRTSATTSATTTSAPSSATTTTASGKLANITLVGTIGPMAIPLAYIQENNLLASVAEKTTFTLWENPDQLRAIISGGQGDFVSLPANGAATFYNKGTKLALLDNTIWNILYVVSADASIKTVADLKGKEVVVPYQGAIPDAQFRFICSKQGVDPDKDLTIYYAPSPVQASQLLLSGQKSIALLSEPSATTVIQKGQSQGMTFYRNLNIADQWDIATGGKGRTPVAGTIALGAIKDNPEAVSVFEQQYAAAVEWMLKNPDAAGQLGAKVLAAQGFTAPAITESIKYTVWQYTPARDAKADLVAFFTQLMQFDPNYVGGKLPDAAFYYSAPGTQ